MKAKKNKRERSPQMKQVGVGLRDVLGAQRAPTSDMGRDRSGGHEQINQLRAQLIEDLVLLSEGKDWSQKPQEERPGCATCGKPLWARGEQTRFIQTTGGEAVKVTRTYGTCPACGVGFFPLDEQLGLLAGGMTPRAEELLVRLARLQCSVRQRRLSL